MADERITELLEATLRHCHAGDLAQAEQTCREALATDAELPDAWNLLAQICYQGGRLSEAGQAADRATGLRPHIPPYWLTRGNIELAANDWVAAQTSFRRAVELDPGFAEAHYRLGLSCLQGLRLADAVAAFRAALRHAPGVADIHYQLAGALKLQGSWPEAMRAYQDAFTLDLGKELDRRPCLDFMRHLHWDTLPAFWDAEITRFFRRDDIDKARYASVGLRALKARGGFRRTLAAPRRAKPDELGDVMANELFAVLLRDALVVNPEFELMLTVLRAQILYKAELRGHAPLGFLCALAQQCFNNGFVYVQTAAEGEHVGSLTQEVESALASGQAVPESLLRSALVLAMYRPLHALAGVDALVAAAQGSDQVSQLLRRSVLDVRAEQALQRDIRAIAPVAQSHEVDETPPHPRWFSIDRRTALPFAEWLQSELPALDVAGVAANPRVLVAGCATGQSAITLATSIAGAYVVATDASLANVAYARRMAAERGVTQVEFRWGDVLPAGENGELYDAILWENGLNGIDDPLATLRTLARSLKPGGWMKLAFHSERARSSVNAARRAARERRIAAGVTAVREFRQHVFSVGKGSELTPLTWFHDFYSLNGCRQLLFCEGERQFRLPQVAELLQDAGLAWAGLANVPMTALAARGRSVSANATEAENWDAFEAKHPETFMGMYRVWVRRTP